MKALNARQKRYLRAEAHKLKPVVIVGSGGLSKSVINEINLSIEHHELIKIRLNAGDRQSRTEMIQTICDTTGSALVFSIGHVAVFYRPAKQPVMSLPK